MKVVDFIKKLNQLGYDENTELVFGVYDNTEFCDWHELGNPVCYRGLDIIDNSGPKDVIAVDMDM
jgi:hypothetical protein